MSNVAMLMRVTDCSNLPKLGLKGPGAEAWLRDRGIDVPPAIYEVRRLADGGLIARFGSADFFLEGADGGELLPQLAAELTANPPRVYRVERHDACWLLSGTDALQALAQICSFDFRSAAANRVVLTRAAGINCMVLPASTPEGGHRVWVDCTFRGYFQDVLREASGAA